MVGYEEDFLSEEEMEWFRWYWTCLPAIIDTKQRHRSPAYFDQPHFVRIFEKLNNRIKEIASDEQITTFNLNWDYLPGGIHSDGFIDHDENDRMGHTYFVPIEMEPNTEFQTIIFDKDSDRAVSLNSELGLGNDGLVTYPQVDREYFDLSDEPFDKDMYNRYLTHLNYDKLSGLKVTKVQEWKLGRALIWPRARLHCSANFEKGVIRNTILIATRKI